jgi:hypothetical protein
VSHQNSLSDYLLKLIYEPTIERFVEEYGVFSTAEGSAFRHHRWHVA